MPTQADLDAANVHTSIMEEAKFRALSINTLTGSQIALTKHSATGIRFLAASYAVRADRARLPDCARRHQGRARAEGLAALASPLSADAFYLPAVARSEVIVLNVVCNYERGAKKARR
jgi:hypothetical protein